jgi:predicted component of type VI protein secretion system
MKHWLTMQGTDGAQQRHFQLSKPRMVIGREPTCDVRVPLSSVAQKHCQIMLDEAGALRLKNLASGATTSHNGAPVEDEAALSNGDTLAIGPVTFVVHISQSDDGREIDGNEIVIERRDA